MNSARQGFFWWEIDVTYTLLRVLARLGVVWDLRGVPARMERRNLVAEVGERCAHLGSKSDRPPAVPAVLERG